MNAIIGMKNAGFTIIDAKNTDGNHGIAIGKNEHEYVTWTYHLENNRKASFYFGHYFVRDLTHPTKTETEAYADYYHRLADAYSCMSRYGY